MVYVLLGLFQPLLPAPTCSYSQIVQTAPSTVPEHTYHLKKKKNRFHFSEPERDARISIFNVYFYNTVREINQKVTSHIQCLRIYQLDRVSDLEKGLFFLLNKGHAFIIKYIISNNLCFTYQ